MQHLSPFDLPNMSQTVSMTFLVSSKVFATSRTSFLRLLGIGEVWILPWNFENSRISKRNTSIDGSRSVETRRDRKCQWSSRNVTVIIFVFLFFWWLNSLRGTFPEFCLRVSLDYKPAFHGSYRALVDQEQGSPTITLLSFLAMTSRHVVVRKIRAQYVGSFPRNINNSKLQSTKS